MKVEKDPLGEDSYYGYCGGVEAWSRPGMRHAVAETEMTAEDDELT